MATYHVPALDASNHLQVKHMAGNGLLCVHWNGSTPATRPTTRTDITIFVDAPAGTAAPSWLLSIDRYETF